MKNQILSRPQYKDCKPKKKSFKSLDNWDS